MAEIFFTSDPHYCHSNILTFVSTDHPSGKVRSEFKSVDEMNETLIENHNKVVSPEDKVYICGDVGFNRIGLEAILPRLNGHMRLILGNHDGFKMSFYSNYFEKIMESRQIDGLLFTHRPVLLGNTERKVKGNVHGHIHEQNIDHDLRYLNISVERTEYTPVSFEWIRDIYRGRGILE